MNRTQQLLLEEIEDAVNMGEIEFTSYEEEFIEKLVDNGEGYRLTPNQNKFLISLAHKAKQFA